MQLLQSSRLEIISKIGPDVPNLLKCIIYIKKNWEKKKENRYIVKKKTQETIYE